MAAAQAQVQGPRLGNAHTTILEVYAIALANRAVPYVDRQGSVTFVTHDFHGKHMQSRFRKLFLTYSACF